MSVNTVTCTTRNTGRDSVSSVSRKTLRIMPRLESSGAGAVYNYLRKGNISHGFGVKSVIR